MTIDCLVRTATTLACLAAMCGMTQPTFAADTEAGVASAGAIPLSKLAASTERSQTGQVVGGVPLGALTSINAAGTQWPITEENRRLAQASVAGLDAKWLATNAPSTYTVKPGDTLWGISSLFLKSAWRWPALWGFNRQEVRNPHLIYPGEVLNLTVVDGVARIQRGGMSTEEVRLSPKIRVEEQLTQAVATIAHDVIAPFLTKPFMLDDDRYAKSGTVYATQDNRLNVGTGGRLHANGISEDAEIGASFSLYRAGRVVKDPQSKDGKKILGVEAVFLGDAKLVRWNSEGTATLEVTNANQEIGKGDRLLSLPSEDKFHFVPRAPEDLIEGRIVMMHDGRTGSSLLASQLQSRPYETEGGPLSIVVVNKGSDVGLETGHVLEIIRPARHVKERSSMGFHEGNRVAEGRRIPAETYGSLMLFKVFGSVSYGIVLEASTSVMPGDEVISAGKAPPR